MEQARPPCLRVIRNHGALAEAAGQRDCRLSLQNLSVTLVYAPLVWPCVYCCCEGRRSGAWLLTWIYGPTSGPQAHASAHTHACVH